MDTQVMSAQQGDSEAFAALYVRHSGFVRAACRTVVDSSEVEDAAQDTWITVRQHIHTFRGEAAFTTWLYRVAVNAARMRWRYCACHAPETVPMEDAVNLPGVRDVQLCCPPVAPPQIPRIQLQEALTTLPAGYRTVLELNAEGYDHAEIAVQLGCTVGTVKSQLFKARRWMRRRLQ